MRRVLRLGVTIVAWALACGPQVVVDDAGESGIATGDDDGTGHVPPSGMSERTTSDSSPTMPTDPACGPSLCMCPAACNSFEQCNDGLWTCICQCNGETDDVGDRTCNVGEVLSAWAYEVGSAPHDCGHAGAATRDWQQSEACFFARLGSEPVMAVWLDVVQPTARAFVTRHGETIEYAYYEVIDQILTGYACEAIVVLPDCVTSPSTLCLSCTAPDPFPLVCFVGD